MVALIKNQRLMQFLLVFNFIYDIKKTVVVVVCVVALKADGLSVWPNLVLERELLLVLLLRMSKPRDVTCLWLISYSSSFL